MYLSPSSLHLFTTTIVKSQFQIAFSDFGDTFFKTFLALKITKKGFDTFILPSSWYFCQCILCFCWYFIGVNSFGFGGGNVHAILKGNTKLKINNGKPTDELPRLVCVSGRTEEGVHVLLDCITSNFDVEQIALIYSAFRWLVLF